MGKVILSLKGIRKSFKSNHVLKGIDLTIEGGEFLGLVGLNGAGKTTLIRIILDFYKQDSGSVEVLGMNPHKSFRKIGPQIGVMLETQSLYPLLTAKEYLETYGALRGLSGKTLHKRSDELLHEIDLFEQRNDLIKTFSKGMRQRLAFARAIMNNPKIIILDEPFDGIDMISKNNLMMILKQARSDHMACLMTSHNMANIESLCHTIAFLKSGTIFEKNTLEKLQIKYADRLSFEIHTKKMLNTQVIQRLLPNAKYDDKEGKIEIILKNDTEKDWVIKKLIENDIPVYSAQVNKNALQKLYLDFFEKAGEKK